MNGMMVHNVHIKVALSRRQPNMGDTHHRRPGLGSRGDELFLMQLHKCNYMYINGLRVVNVQRISDCWAVSVED